MLWECDCNPCSYMSNDQVGIKSLTSSAVGAEKHLKTQNKQFQGPEFWNQTLL